MKTKNAFRAILVMVFLTALMYSPARSENVQSDIRPDTNEEAMAIAIRMADFLAQAQSFSVTADIRFDAVQESGQKIEFGETRKIVLARPERLRIDSTKRSGEKSQLIFNGQSLSLNYEDAKVYASEPKAGTVDEVIRHLMGDLDIRLPLGEMLSSGLVGLLKEKIQEAVYVEESVIDGVICDHVAFRGEDRDMQVWVAKNGDPLPQRVVITYKSEDGQPQFQAQFSDWDLAPEVSDTLFAFTPPQDARKVAFSPRQGAEAMKTEEAKEDKS